jgi:hypothetical protein
VLVVVWVMAAVVVSCAASDRQNVTASSSGLIDTTTRVQKYKPAHADNNINYNAVHDSSSNRKKDNRNNWHRRLRMRGRGRGRRRRSQIDKKRPQELAFDAEIEEWHLHASV